MKRKVSKCIKGVLLT